MRISTKQIKLSLISKNELCDLSFKPDQTFIDLKTQIKINCGYDPDSYFIFYKNKNLSNCKNKSSLISIFQEKKKKTEKSEVFFDNIIYLIPIKDYLAKEKELKLQKCTLHTGNYRYLYCSMCRSLVCDECVFEQDSFFKQTQNEELVDNKDKEINKCDHLSSKVNDVINILISYDMKIKAFDNLMKKEFKDGFENEIEENFNKMKKKLVNYINEEKKRGEKISENLKNLIDSYLKIENKKYDAMLGAGLNYISDFKNEIQTNLNGFDFLKEISNKKVSKVSKQDNDVAYRAYEGMKKNQEIAQIHQKIKDIKSQYINFETLSPHYLFESNKSINFKTTMNKLIFIVNAKLTSKNIQNEAYFSNLLTELKKISNFKSLSSAYNSAMNISVQNSNCIYQPIDLTKTLCQYNISTNKFIFIDIDFSPLQRSVLNSNKNFNVSMTSPIKVFPKYSRSFLSKEKKIFVTGGEINSTPLNSVLIIDAEIKNATMSIPMLKPHVGHTLLNLGNSFAVISGAYGNNLCEIYNFQKKTWSQMGMLNSDRIGAGVLVYDANIIFIFFGKKWDHQRNQWIFVDTVEKYELNKPLSNWEVVEYKNNDFIPKNILHRSFCAVCSCQNDRNYILGGEVIQNGKVEGCNEVIEVMANFNRKYLEFRKANKITMEYGMLFLNSCFYLYSSIGYNFDSEGNICQFSFLFNEVNTIDNIEFYNDEK